MGQEFIIKSETLEDKINQLLPSQGGFAAGVDLSASTTIVPIVDLTESAEGSNIRQDLQTAYGLNTTTFDLTGGTTTVLDTTGYYRVKGIYRAATATSTRGKLQVSDATTTKDILNFATTVVGQIVPYDLIIYLAASHYIQIELQTNANINGAIKQIADVNGNLTTN